VEEERIEHPSVQAAVDFAVERLQRGYETTVHLNGTQETIMFKPLPGTRTEEKQMMPVAQRVGDSLRDQYLGLLRQACTQGYITQQEFSQRSDAALVAVTRAELAVLVLDLNEMEPEKPDLPEPHHHKACVNLPVVILLMCLSSIVTTIVGLIIIFSLI
jgi:hypothetical protein